MATGTDAGGTWNTTAGNKTVTATPAVSDLIVVVHGMSGWASGDDSVITDNNSDGLGTYYRIGSATAPMSTGGGTAGALWISIRNSPIGSASSTVFTATNTGDTGGGLTVLRFSGMNRFGQNAVKQSIGESSATENPPTITFSATTLTGNPVILAVMGEDNPAGVTEPTGFTEADDTGWASPTAGIQVCWDDSGNTATLFSWSGGALTDHNEVGLELDTTIYGIVPSLGNLVITGYAPTVTLAPAGGFRSLAVPWVYGFGKTGLAVSTGLGQLTLTGYAPDVRVPVQITPGLGALTFTGLAPTITTQFRIDTGLGQLTFTGQAPSLTEQVRLATGLGQLVFAGQVPTPAVTEHQFAAPEVGQLTLSGQVPSVLASENKTVSTDLGQLSLSGQVPTLSASDHKFVSTGLGELTLTGYAPQVGDSPNIQPGLGQLVITGLTPSLSLTVDKGFRAWPFLGPYGFGSAPGYIFTGVGQLVITGYAPSVVSPLNISTGLGQLTFTGYNPALTIGGNTTVSTGLGELVFTGYMPTQTLTLPSPQPAALVLTGYAPSVSTSAGSQTANPGLGQLILTGFAPDLRIPVQISSELGQLTLTGFAPSISVTQSVDTGVGQLVLTGFAPFLSATEHHQITVGLGQLDFTGLAPSVSATDHKWADAALAQLLINCFAPSIQIGTGPEITTGLGELVITGYAPSSLGGEAMVVSTGAGKPRKRRRERYVAKYKDKLYQFETVEELEEFVENVKSAEAEKPKRNRAAVKISLTPEFSEEASEYVSIPPRIQAMPVGAAMAQIRRIEGIFEKMLAEAQRKADEDEEELLMILL